MAHNARLKYLFVLNKGSGTNAAGTWEEAIEKFFAGKAGHYELYHLPEKIEVAAIKKQLLAKLPEKIIGVGGDGTISLLANMLAGSNIPLGILPAGSANGMAKELNIPTDAAKALDIICTGNVTPTDLIQINDRFCMHLSDLGLNAQLIKHFDEGKLRGKWGYARVVLKTLLAKQEMQVRINSESEVVSRTAVMVAFANAKTYGTGAVINPEGKIDDGLFEIIIVKKLKFTALLRMFFKPGLFNPKHIEIISCREAQVRTHRSMHFQIDGEYIGKEKNVKAVIKANALLLLLPEPAEAAL